MHGCPRYLLGGMLRARTTDIDDFGRVLAQAERPIAKTLAGGINSLRRSSSWSFAKEKGASPGPCILAGLKTWTSGRV